MTSSFTQLSDELSEVERQIIAIRLKCEEKVQSEDERCAQVERKREECIEEHKKTVADAVEEYEEQIRGVRERADEQVGRTKQETSEALERARVATEKAVEAETRAKKLERELYKLRRVLDAALLDEEKRTRQVKNETEERVHQRLEDTNNYIRDMARYASEIQNSVVHSVETMHDDHKVSIKDTEVASTQRSRYKELYDTALEHGRGESSREEMEGFKTELVQGWHDDWVGIATVGRQELWTDKLRLEGSAEDPLKPADAACPRPVERARAHVLERERRAEERATSPLARR